MKLEFEHERQAWANAEQARAKAERTLEQARKAMETEVENTKLPPTTLGEEGAERRVTFIIRLTVDERGQPRRTEIEHARSGKKEAFPGLDVQRLAAFMEAFIGPLNSLRTDDLSTPSNFSARDLEGDARESAPL